MTIKDNTSKFSTAVSKYIQPMTAADRQRQYQVIAELMTAGIDRKVQGQALLFVEALKNFPELAELIEHGPAAAAQMASYRGEPLIPARPATSLDNQLTPAEQAFANNHDLVISRGSKGAEVANIKALLIRVGALDAVNPKTGQSNVNNIYDRTTETAVKKFQAANHREPTGTMTFEDMVVLAHASEAMDHRPVAAAAAPKVVAPAVKEAGKPAATTPELVKITVGKPGEAVEVKPSYTPESLQRIELARQKGMPGNADWILSKMTPEQLAALAQLSGDARGGNVAITAKNAPAVGVLLGVQRPEDVPAVRREVAAFNARQGKGGSQITLSDILSQGIVDGRFSAPPAPIQATAIVPAGASRVDVTVVGGR